jgi:hypothetical protein
MPESMNKHNLRNNKFKLLLHLSNASLLFYWAIVTRHGTKIQIPVVVAGVYFLLLAISKYRKLKEKKE